jgi:hypothetical protein
MGQKPFVGIVAAAAAHSLVEFAFRIPLASWPILIKVIQSVLASQKTPEAKAKEELATPVSTPQKPPVP